MPLFSEQGIKAHGYFFIAGLVLLIMFLVYVYLCEHQKSVVNDEMWRHTFTKEGINPITVTHDDSMWYHNGRSTCVAYNGDFESKCSRSENYCAGGDVHGTNIQQAKAVKKAIHNRGEHPLCPLIYQGAD